MSPVVRLVVGQEPEKIIMRYMVDTNIFGNLVSGELSMETLPRDGEFCATPVQRAELNDASGDLKAQLLSKFNEIVDSKMVRSAFAFGVPGAGFDEGEWRNDANTYNAVKTALDEAWEKLPGRKKKKHKKENNAKDALIAEVAKLRDFSLLTCDSALADAAKANGIRVCYPKPGGIGERNLT
jgi:predicted nucleic acid-binding protein